MNQEIHAERILIIDFGSQYTQLIARRVRELNVYCEIHSWSMTDQQLKDFSPTGIILSGGPNSVNSDKAPQISGLVFGLGCPVLGVCYGMQAMAQQLGGAVKYAEKHEYGCAKVEVHGHSQLFSDIEDELSPEGNSLLDVWMSHGDSVTAIPENFQVIANTKDTPIAAMGNDELRMYGIQFHPEVTQTLQGKRILGRFVKKICGCQGLWTPENIVTDRVEKIKAQVGSDTVILGLSGGVDSSVAAVLLHRAIGKQLICVFVDNGLLRLDEAEQVKKVFEEHLQLNLVCVDAREDFISALAGVSDPEEKRKVIGAKFIDIFEMEAKELGDIHWLAQGTIYPDIIESAGVGSDTAHVIKSHHNVGGLPERMSLDLIEPLSELFKDEVRALGIELGLPLHMIHRHPFPGPGLGVRILGEVKQEYIDILQKADQIFMNELWASGWYEKTSQAFAVFLPVKSVGVKGDARSYDYVIALRAVETTDFMTAQWAHLPHQLLSTVANRIMNEVPGISRVTYDISSKPPATIEWE